MADSLDLTSYGYVAPFESMAAFRKVLAYADKHHLAVDTIVYICIRPELQPVAQKLAPTAAIIDVDLPTAAHERLWSMVAPLTDLSERSSFIWAILLAWHSYYCQQALAARVVADTLVAGINNQSRLLLTCPGSLWGNTNEQIGHDDPLLYLALQDSAHEKGIAYSRLSVEPAILYAWQHLRYGTQAVVTAGNLLLNFILGLISPRKPVATGGTVAFLPEAIAYVDRASTTIVTYQNVRLKDSATWASSLYSLAKKMTRFVSQQSQTVMVSRLDPRTKLAGWLSFLIIPLPLSAVASIQTAWREARQGTEELTKQLRQLEPYTFRGWRMRHYTGLVIKNYQWEFLLSRIIVESLLQTLQPKVIFYPDGYTILGRLLQVIPAVGLQERIQVPHGHGNHYFPTYFYQADRYLATDHLTQQHLLAHGVAPQKIWLSTKEAVTPPSQRQPRTITNPRITIFYTGVYGYWAFPSFLTELHEITLQTLTAIWHQWPHTRIVLKTHPNGTNQTFFKNILAEYPVAVQMGQLQLIAKAWAKDAEYEQTDVAVALAIVPSSPTVIVQKLGIPLVILVPPHLRRLKLLYGPFYDHVTESASMVPDVPALVAQLHKLCQDI